MEAPNEGIELFSDILHPAAVNRQVTEWLKANTDKEIITYQIGGFSSTSISSAPYFLIAIHWKIRQDKERNL